MLQTASAKGEVVNLGKPVETTILELAQKIKEITKSKSAITFRPLPKDDPKRRCPDISKLKKLVECEPEVSFEEGLSKTINWFPKKKQVES